MIRALVVALVVAFADPPCGGPCAEGCTARRREERAECIRRFPGGPTGEENWPARSACFDLADARETACKRACKAHCRRVSP